MRSYVEMGYQAINIGVQDWAGGIDYLLARIRERKYPFLCTNLTSNNPMLTLPPGYSILTAGGCKVGVIGVMGNSSLGLAGDSGLSVSDPIPAIKHLVSRLRRECLFIVLLSNLGQKMDTDIAGMVEGINVIIGSGSGIALFSPANINGTYLCRSKSKGQWLGRLDINLTPEGAVKGIKHQVLMLDDSVPEDEKKHSEIEALFKE